MKKANTIATLQRLENDVFPIIYPKQILSDHGTQFTAKKWKTRLEELNIQPTYSSIRHASSNPSERYMKELGRLLRTYCHDKHNSWAKYIPNIENCLNSLPHTCTGLSPFEIIYGIKLPHTLDGILQKYIDTQEGPINMQQIKEQLLKMAVRRAKQQKNQQLYTKLDNKYS